MHYSFVSENISFFSEFFLRKKWNASAFVFLKCYGKSQRETSSINFEITMKLKKITFLLMKEKMFNKISVNISSFFKRIRWILVLKNRKSYKIYLHNFRIYYALLRSSTLIQKNEHSYSLMKNLWVVTEIRRLALRNFNPTQRWKEI